MAKFCGAESMKSTVAETTPLLFTIFKKANPVGLPFISLLFGVEVGENSVLFVVPGNKCAILEAPTVVPTASELSASITSNLSPFVKTPPVR